MKRNDDRFTLLDVVMWSCLFTVGWMVSHFTLIQTWNAIGTEATRALIGMLAALGAGVIIGYKVRNK